MIAQGLPHPRATVAPLSRAFGKRYNADMRILFYDGVARFPYDAESMRKTGLGGTESTLVRVAEGLSSSHDVAVAQRGRSRKHVVHTHLKYLSTDDPDPFNGHQPDWVVILRKHKLVRRLGRQYPNARLGLWLHNWQRRESMFYRGILSKYRCMVITVSEAHRRDTDRLLNSQLSALLGTLIGGTGSIPVHTVYNPVNPDLRPNRTPHDPDKLIFFSTANKGLEQVLNTFSLARKSIPSLKLVVAGSDPRTLYDYSKLNSEMLEQPGLEIVGRLPQLQVIRHVRESLCVFYPQDRHPETFGLIYAESNAVGTPVLAHDFGSAKEVLSSEDQLVDCRNIEQITNKLKSWRISGRPEVHLKPCFALDHVLAKWDKLLRRNQ